MDNSVPIAHNYKAWSNRQVHSRMVSLIFSITRCFSFTQNRLIFHACIDDKTLKLLFKSFHKLFWHNKTFFCSSKIFPYKNIPSSILQQKYSQLYSAKIFCCSKIFPYKNIPLPFTPGSVTIIYINLCKLKFSRTNVTPKKPKGNRGHFTTHASLLRLRKKYWSIDLESGSQSECMLCTSLVMLCLREPIIF